jgi:hypothetical protein
MPWPVSTRTSGEVITTTYWNEAMQAFSTWADAVNGGGNDALNIGAVQVKGIKTTYVQMTGSDTITPEISNGFIQVDLNRAVTTLAAPTYNGTATLPEGIHFKLKLVHSTNSSDVVWGTNYIGADGFELHGGTGYYNVFPFVSRPDGNVEIESAPLIGVLGT